MLKKVWMIAFMVVPAFGMAAETSAPLKFFGAVPGQQNSNAESAPRFSTKEFDRLLEMWGDAELGDSDDVQQMKLPSDPALRAEMLQNFFLYRAAKRAASLAEGRVTEQPNLHDDFEWATKNGLTVLNSQALVALDQKLNGMTREQQLEYALKVPGTLGQTMLDGALSQSVNPEFALKFLIQYHKSFAPERRSTLIFRYLSQMSLIIGHSNAENMNIIRQAASLMDYRSPQTICRSVANGYLPPFSAQTLRGDLREHLEIMTRGFVEMKKQNVDCRGSSPPDILLLKLEALERSGLYQKGFFTSLIQNLKRSVSMQSQSESNADVAPVPNQQLDQCLVDQSYKDNVGVEINKTKEMPIGGRMLFGSLSKGGCKLAVDITKLKSGFQAYIVLDNSAGANLFKFDRTFMTIQEMKIATIFGLSPEEIAAKNQAHSKNPR